MVSHAAAAAAAAAAAQRARSVQLRVRVEIMGSQKCRNVGKSQSLVIMINPMISTRTRDWATTRDKARMPRTTLVDLADVEHGVTPRPDPPALEA
jgi:hypothetical protein